MRRSSVLGSSVLASLAACAALLCACGPKPADVPMPNAATITPTIAEWDLFADPTVPDKLDRLAQAARSTEVYEITMEASNLTAVFKTPTGEAEYSVSEAAPEPERRSQGLSSHVEHRDAAIPVATIDLQAIKAAVPLRCNEPAERRLVFLEAAGPGQAWVLYSCEGNWQQRVWLSDLKPVALDMNSPGGITETISRLGRGTDGRANEIILDSDKDAPAARVKDRGLMVSIDTAADQGSPERLEVSSIVTPSNHQVSFPLSGIDTLRLDQCRRKIAGDAPWAMTAYADDVGNIRYQWRVNGGQPSQEVITDQTCRPS